MLKRHLIRLIGTALSAPVAFGTLHVASGAPASATHSETASSSAIDPKAVALLKASSAKIKALPSFTVYANSTTDEVVRDGLKVQKAMIESVVVMKKPDRMRAQVSGDDGNRLFVYDGKVASLLRAPENDYARVSAPPTLDAMLGVVPAQVDVQLPLADLLYTSAAVDLATYITEAGIIGPSKVVGAPCDHVAFRTKLVDWQVWIDRDGLLPRKLVVTTRGDEAAPQYAAVLTWDTRSAISESSFAFDPPAGALPMRVSALVKTEATPVKSPSSKAKTAAGLK